jgi:hypothetical protein
MKFTTMKLSARLSNESERKKGKETAKMSASEKARRKEGRPRGTFLLRKRREKFDGVPYGFRPRADQLCKASQGVDIKREEARRSEKKREEAR